MNRQPMSWRTRDVEQLIAGTIQSEPYWHWLGPWALSPLYPSRAARKKAGDRRRYVPVVLSDPSVVRSWKGRLSLVVKT